MYGTLVDPTALKRLNSSEDKLEKLKNEVGPITVARKLAAQKDEVRDEHGRRRFHGAFTGGFSAGYFNTVGSAEGWQPKTFTSSRASKAAEQVLHGGGAGTQRAPGHGVLDYMDEEDAEQILAGSMGLKESVGATRTRDGAVGEEDLFQSIISGKRHGAPAGAPAASQSVQGMSATAAEGRAPVLQLGSLPPELQAPKRISIGERLLRTLGWREGRKLGSKRAVTVSTGPCPQQEPARAHAHAGQEEDEAVLRRMWAVGTSRPVSARSGLGYDSGSLRSLGASGEGGQSAAHILAAQDAMGRAEGTKRLHMSAVLGGQSRGYTFASALSSALLAGDEEGEDDGGVYRSVDLTAYDIVSARHATALDVSRKDKKERERLGLTGRGAGGVGGGLEAREHASLLLGDERQEGDRQRRLLQDAVPGKVVAGRSKDTQLRVGFDGNPALPGFRLAQQRELGFLQFGEAYAPPVPPSGWVPRAPTLHTQEPLPLYAAHGFIPVSAAAPVSSSGNSASATGVATSVQRGVPVPGSTSTAAATPAPPAPSVPIRATAQAQGPARGVDPLLASRFVKEGDAPGGTTSSSPASSVFAALHAPVPVVGVQLSLTHAAWAPSRLVLKRLGLPDPLTQAERAKLEGGPPPVESVGPEWGTVLQAAQAAAAKAGIVHGGGVSTGSDTLSSDEKQQLALDPTYAPLVAPKPSAQMFKAIFDSDSESE